MISDGDIVNPGDIACKPCFKDGGGKFRTGTDVLTVGQGSSVLACIEMKYAGACVRHINKLDFDIERSTDLWKRYCILSDDGTKECLFLVDNGLSNPNYSPALSGYDRDGKVKGVELLLMFSWLIYSFRISFARCHR